ncbi:MAG: flippase [Chlorobi bacterium]|nr:flippase [Chlorobiota bacterium]
MSKLIAFFTTVYLARAITPEGFGIIGFATAFVSYFILFIDLGLDTISIKKIANDQAVIGNYVNNVLSFRILISVIIYLLLALIILLIDLETIQKSAILLLGLNLFVQSITLDFVFQATEKIKYLSIKVISKNLLALVLVLIFIRNISDVLLVIVIFVLTNLIVSVWMLIKYSNLFESFNWGIDNRFIKKLIAESFPLAISAFMISIYYNLDMVMLGVIKTEVEVGIYNAVYRIFMIGILPIGVIVKILLPSLSRISNRKELANSLIKYGTLLFVSSISAAIVFYLYAGNILNIIFGKQYLSGTYALMIISFNIAIIGVNVFFGNPLTVWGKQRQYAIAITFGAIANIILNILLIPKFSYNGAAFATLLSEVVVFVGVFYLFNKNLRNIILEKK